MELFVNTDSTEFSGKEDLWNDSVCTNNQQVVNVVLSYDLDYLRLSLSPTTPFTYPLT